MRRPLVQLVALLMAVFGASGVAHATVGLLIEEPYGHLGQMSPTGHAALYFDHLCSDDGLQLRTCTAGEYGVVISRYHHIAGHDWIAVPLLPYLYAVNDLNDVPQEVDAERVAALREAYRGAHLSALIPDPKAVPEWTQLVGSLYDRRIYVMEVATTEEQDRRLMEKLNDSPNESHFNFFFHNCADFSREQLNRLFPGAVRRNYVADFGMTTPKQVGRAMARYAKRRPELGLRVVMLPQVEGEIGRSHHVDGVAEALVRSKKYLVPLVTISPVATIGIAAAYVTNGRFSLSRALQRQAEKDGDSIGLDALLPSVTLASKPAEEPAGSAVLVSSSSSRGSDANFSLPETEPTDPVAIDLLSRGME